MNLQDAEKFLQEQQNILENQRQQKTRRVQQAFFYDSRTVCSLKCYSLDPKLSKDGRVELAVPRLSFMSLILILRYLKTGFVYQRK
ncbi:hypothetical protein [Acinetobacter lwoffii]|uniref:hypothetical protein n=1 Tax=Acinetobacter lwoffii TaxID=28090 RepID=UPI001E2BDC84|nr:hypothetical protein [Acinetobacter lwoffii]